MPHSNNGSTSHRTQMKAVVQLLKYARHESGVGRRSKHKAYPRSASVGQLRQVNSVATVNVDYREPDHQGHGVWVTVGLIAIIADILANNLQASVQNMGVPHGHAID